MIGGVNQSQGDQMERTVIWTSLIVVGFAGAFLAPTLVASRVTAQPAPSQPTWELRTDNSGVMAWKLNTVTGDAYFCIIGQQPKCSLVANKTN
jgi:hypothetical protein